jgi:hypothetical protein
MPNADGAVIRAAASAHEAHAAHHQTLQTGNSLVLVRLVGLGGRFRFSFKSREVVPAMSKRLPLVVGQPALRRDRLGRLKRTRRNRAISAAGEFEQDPAWLFPLTSSFRPCARLPTQRGRPSSFGRPVIASRDAHKARDFKSRQRHLCTIAQGRALRCRKRKKPRMDVGLDEGSNLCTDMHRRARLNVPN